VEKEIKIGKKNDSVKGNMQQKEMTKKQRE
jgi:hypothetical protein